ncbi:methyl-accepting chemotaxis protein [Clostridium grantii]|uniref:Methyl-accepting chemotaxis protein n=1 Tax=Clostridium grantii DSM 8605 TaxID=1121316 RepID=A0A1M5W6A2_9CLOT|nr:methyl-accepting chemotaxis protein [Clostridium grantii]SHH83005.1 Methyl-accepting chemotaxis protein [Clostridium grantii DSM 8605]
MSSRKKLQSKSKLTLMYLFYTIITSISIIIGIIEIYKNNANTITSSIVIMISLLIVSIILSFTYFVLLNVFISNPIRTVLKSVDLLKDGDFNYSLDIKAESPIKTLADSITTMSDNLNDTLLNINEATDQVTSGAKKVANSSASLAQGSTQQASSIEELTASIAEIASQTKQNAESANKAKAISTTAQDNLGQSFSQMQEMLSAMEEINSASNNISKIIKVIDEIAFQTNILALNAAVEAARAGQHGKGFAVVAEEVRNLAARSANAAKETTSMIEDSIKKVTYGTKIADTTAEALMQVVSGVEEVTSLVDSIAIASNQQTIGVDQINIGITQIGNIVQITSSTSEETASASQQLFNQSEVLKNEITKFKLKSRNGKSNKKNIKGLNPEVSMLLDNMNKKNTINANSSDEFTLKSKPAINLKSIDLSDNEFGKY